MRTREVFHPINGRKYILTSIYSKPSYTISWCNQLNCFGIKAWFSDRIWWINNKIEVLL